MHHPECKTDEEFVGNTNVDKDRTYLSTIKYRLGEQAYTIHGKPIDAKRLLPLFIHKTDFNRYNQIMESMK